MHLEGFAFGLARISIFGALKKLYLMSGIISTASEGEITWNRAGLASCLKNPMFEKVKSTNGSRQVREGDESRQPGLLIRNIRIFDQGSHVGSTFRYVHYRCKNR